MYDDQVDKVRALYPRSMMPDPALLKLEHTQPGRRWIPLNGPHAGQLGAEHCATKDFSWVGLKFRARTCTTPSRSTN